MPGKTYITIVGNTGSDAELRYTPTGTAVASFSVAVTPRFMQDNAWQDGETTWYRVSAWRSLAENVADTIQKGMRVIVYGSLENREWTDSDENTRHTLEITADAIGPDLMFATARLSKSEREQAEPEPARSAKPAGKPNASARRPATSRR